MGTLSIRVLSSIRPSVNESHRPRARTSGGEKSRIGSRETQDLGDFTQGSELGLTRMTACGGRDSLGCDLIRSSVMDVALERPRLRRLLDHFAEVADPREPWRV